MVLDLGGGVVLINYIRDVLRSQFLELDGSFPALAIDCKAGELTESIKELRDAGFSITEYWFATTKGDRKYAAFCFADARLNAITEQAGRCIECGSEFPTVFWCRRITDDSGFKLMSRSDARYWYIPDVRMASIATIDKLLEVTNV